MAYLNVKQRTLETKIVYYGAGLSGKTTNLEKIKENAPDGKCGDMMSLNTDGDRTLFFDWLPFNIGKFNGCDVRVQLYTVPGQTKYAETRSRVLSSADGVVLVLDSQAGAIERNRQTLKDLREHMRENGLDPRAVPIVVQLNKRDLPTAMAVPALLEALELSNAPHMEAVASKGTGVFETLRLAIKLVLDSVRASARAGGSEIAAGDDSRLDGHTLHQQLVRTAAVAPVAAAEAAPALARVAHVAVGGAVANAAQSAAVQEPVKRVASLSAVVGGVRGESRRESIHGGDETSTARTGELIEHIASRVSNELAKRAPAAAAEGAMNEVIAAQRALGRRLEGLEATLQRNLERAIAGVEATTHGKLSALQGLPSAMSELATSVTLADAKLEGLSGELAQLRDEVHAVACDAQALPHTVDERVARALAAELAKTAASIGSSQETTSADLSKKLASYMGELRGEMARNIEALRSGQLSPKQIESTMASVSAVLLDGLQQAVHSMITDAEKKSASLAEIEGNLKAHAAQTTVQLEGELEVMRQDLLRVLSESVLPLHDAVREVSGQSKKTVDAISLRLADGFEQIRSANASSLDELRAGLDAKLERQTLSQQKAMEEFRAGLDAKKLDRQALTQQKAIEELRAGLELKFERLASQQQKNMEDLRASLDPKLERHASAQQKAMEALRASLEEQLERHATSQQKAMEEQRRLLEMWAVKVKTRFDALDTSAVEALVHSEGAATASREHLERTVGELRSVVEELALRVEAGEARDEQRTKGLSQAVTALTNELRTDKKSWWRG